MVPDKVGGAKTGAMVAGTAAGGLLAVDMSE